MAFCFPSTLCKKSSNIIVEFHGLARGYLQNKEELKKVIEDIRQKNGRIAGYGVPAKGNTTPF